MTPTKLLIGQILIVLAIVLLGLWCATQWCAAELAYQSQLGAPWFVLYDVPIYHPWAFFAWWYHFDAYAPHIFDRAGAIAGASGFAGCGAAIIGSFWRARQSRHVTTYGSERWASVEEIRRAGLFGEAGVFLGGLNGSYIRHNYSGDRRPAQPDDGRISKDQADSRARAQHDRARHFQRYVVRALFIQIVARAS